jgi:hypothetical protein
MGGVIPAREHCVRCRAQVYRFMQPIRLESLRFVIGAFMKVALFVAGLFSALAVLVPGPARAADGAVLNESASPQAPPGLRAGTIGLMADGGLPDGLTAALVVRPADWARMHFGAGSNSSSPGLRGGLTLLPFGIGPSLSVELGHSLEGETNGLVRSFVGFDSRFRSYFRRVSYTYANAHLGLDFGRRWVTFFIHGGLSYVWARLHGVESLLQGEADQITADSGTPTTITVYEDPRLRVIAPSVKVGLIFYLQ